MVAQQKPKSYMRYNAGALAFLFQVSIGLRCESLKAENYKGMGAIIMKVFSHIHASHIVNGCESYMMYIVLHAFSLFSNSY